MKTCPKCNLANPDSSLRCDCGEKLSSTDIKMLVTTTSQIDGHGVVEYLGIVRGEVILSTNFISRILSLCTSLFGIRMFHFEKVFENARAESFKQMVQQANNLGANAIISMRFEVSAFPFYSTCLLAYGTAVKTKSTSI